MINQQSNTIAEWLRQKRALIALLRQDNYRRDLIGLFVTNLRALAGWKFILGLALLAAVGGYVVFLFGDTAAKAYEMLQIIFGIAAIGGGAALYGSEREAGTFELLWLATGSERVLLRLKIMTMLLALVALQVPAVILTAKVTAVSLPAMQTILFLAMNTFLILAVMTLVSTFLPQPWAGGFVGAALLAAVYVSLRGNVSAFSPFRNPFVEGALSPSNSAINRVLIFFLSIFFIDAAARRLRRSF